jgi:hypothetical protein
MARAHSTTHDLVVLMQDNGELQEDVVAKSATDDEDSVDLEDEESFPASDPPSSWAGPPEEQEATDRSRLRVQHREPIEEVPERAHPAEPLPQTLRRDDTTE